MAHVKMDCDEAVAGVTDSVREVLSCCSSPANSSPSASEGSCDSSSTTVYHPHAEPEVQLEDEIAALLREQEKGSVATQGYIHHLFADDNAAAASRTSVVDWMVEVSNQLQLSNDSAFLGVQLFDKYLQNVFNSGTRPAAVFSQPGQLQFAAITALWVAAKYEDASHLSAASLVQLLLCNMTPACKVKQLLSAEKVLLTAVDHRLTCPTTKGFLRRCMSSVSQAHMLDMRVYFTASYLAELSLLDAGMLIYRPSEVAASAYAYALAVTGNTCSAAHLKQHTGYDLALIVPCMLRLARVHSAACNTTRPCMISLKYLTEPLCQVAALPAAELDYLVLPHQSYNRASDRYSSSGANNQVAL